MSDIERLDRMIKHLREMKADFNRMQKLSDKDWIGMDLIKRRHELHALAVELGFAERRDNYNAIELRDNWHVFNYKPREPNL